MASALLLVGCEPRVSARPVAKVALSIDRAVVYRPATADERKTVEALHEGVVVVRTSSAVSKDAAATLSAAYKHAETRYPSGSRLTILSAGPVLDSPDEVVVRGLFRRGQHLDLEILYTSARIEGRRLRRNVQWRPLALVPVDLPDGGYQLRVSWQAVKSIPNGPVWDVAPLVQSGSFEVQPAR